ncbi:type II toxin-antitoxin system mRNA interferase toxin, RelE/StbE family [Candidatus Gracilibacteria bacterium]|nr:type II toxin-antitoxin system mRNA interferase toxin, RelE/StbE family [Candidatus Gracilibacteria bacterium]
MDVKYTKSYKKSFSKLDSKIKTKTIERIAIFSVNPFEKILNNHKLLGEYDGYRSINITGDYRAIFREYPDGTYEFVEFIDIGTHSKLYQ